MVNYLLQFEDLSSEEQEGVKQLKHRMAGHMDFEMMDDLSLFVRFLRARDLNINAAEAMLRNHLEWRKIIQIDTIATNFTPTEVMVKYVTLDIIGNDMEGSPIMYFNLGKIDSRGLLKSCRKVDVMKTIFQKLETSIEMMSKESKKIGKYVDKWTMILNFDNLSFAVATHKETLELLGNLIVMYEANYPERLKVAYFLNASIYFTMAFAVVKHFLSERTYRKIKIFGREGWREEILKIVDPEVLPAFLGGNRTDPDGNPLCLSVVTHGGTVPEKYFIKKTDTLANKQGVEKLTVTRMSKTQLTLNVLEAGSYIEWEFETKVRDIGFALYYKQSHLDTKLKDIIPKQRIDTAMSSETGMYKCTKPGIYVIEFDNSYSWLFGKEIYYKVSVVKNELNE